MGYLLRKRILKSSAYLKNVLRKRDAQYPILYTEKRLSRLKSSGVFLKKPLLDIGCGYAYPSTFIMNLKGIPSIGIDISPLFWRDGLRAFFQYNVRSKGVIRALIETPMVFSHEKKRFEIIEKKYGQKRLHKDLQLFSYDGRCLPCLDGEFGSVVSQNVLEHVSDMNGFFREVARVMLTGGLIDMAYHNYYCPSGAHLPVDLKDPWAHLRGTVPPLRYGNLNKLHPCEIAAAAEENGIIIEAIEAESFCATYHNAKQYESCYEDVPMASSWEAQIIDMVAGRFEKIPLRDRFSISNKDMIYVSRWLLRGKKV